MKVNNIELLDCPINNYSKTNENILTGLVKHFYKEIMTVNVVGLEDDFKNRCKDILKKHFYTYYKDKNNIKEKIVATGKFYKYIDDFYYNSSNNKSLNKNALTVESLFKELELDPYNPLINLYNVKSTNEDYCKKELDWYLSQDLSIINHVDDVKIWNECATKDDKKLVNSNYGYLVFSKENGSQFENCLKHLIRDKNTRNALIIYNRPNIHTDMSKDGMHDMICTMYSQFFIRDNKLEMFHNMRSNDFIFGFFNDFYWNCYIYQNMYNCLKETYPSLKVGKIHWISNSMHVYLRHFELLLKIYMKYKFDYNYDDVKTIFK